MDPALIEIFKALYIVLGALCATLGGFIQSRLNEKNKKSALLANKLERAYELCQEIYDGHNREIINARKHLPHDKDSFLENRRHPGKETSELKMLIRSYSPDISGNLETIDNGHGELKKSFIKIEEMLLSSDLFTTEEFNQKATEWLGYLEVLGRGSYSLKRDIERKLNKLAN